MFAIKSLVKKAKKSDLLAESLSKNDEVKLLDEKRAQNISKFLY